jgi:hypothetical protein
MRAVAGVLAISFMLFSQPRAVAQGDCNNLVDQMFAGSLYFGPSGCKTLECFHQVVLNGEGRASTPLKRNTNYDFIYKSTDRVTSSGSIVNSMVAVQIKHLGSDEFASKNTKPVNVILQRDWTPFACSADQRKPFGLTMPDEKINYDAYDRYHRWGRFYTQNDKYLHNRFHIYYDNGYNYLCVATDDPNRAPLFLMHGRDAVPGTVEKIAYHTGATTVAREFGLNAYAQTPSERKEVDERSDIIPYVQLKMLLTNYQKVYPKPGCFGFSASTAVGGHNGTPKELDISFSDLEDSIQNFLIPLRYQQTVYHFGIVE